MKHKYLQNVTTLAFDATKCIGCGHCTEVCPHGVFEVKERNAHVIDRDSCMECGACAMNCPAGALDVNAGVGCAAAIIMSWFTGGEPICGCSDDGDSVCCG
jgi:NAD-dependent dihydropyrimidine dehydrogenase PreA subunit